MCPCVRLPVRSLDTPHHTTPTPGEDCCRAGKQRNTRTGLRRCDLIPVRRLSAYPRHHSYTLSVQVLVDGEALKNSPFLLDATRAQCPVASQQANADGVCFCVDPCAPGPKESTTNTKGHVAAYEFSLRVCRYSCSTSD